MAIIRPAAAHGLARIEEIYDAIHTAEEAGNVSIGWVRGVYPTRATAQAALDAGELFVLESDGTVYAAGRINREQVPVYAEVPWAHDAAPEQVLVLHTLVVDPAAAGHGYGSTALIGALFAAAGFLLLLGYARKYGSPILGD